MGVGGFAQCIAAGTSRQGGCEGDDQVSAHCRDRVYDVSFATDGQRLGVCDFGNRQASRIDRRHRRQLRGKSSPARRSGRHRRRCTRWRDDGSRASPVRRSTQGRVPVSASSTRIGRTAIQWLRLRPRSHPDARGPDHTRRAGPKPGSSRTGHAVSWQAGYLCCASRRGRP